MEVAGDTGKIAHDGGMLPVSWLPPSVKFVIEAMLLHEEGNVPANCFGRRFDFKTQQIHNSYIHVVGAFKRCGIMLLHV